MTGVAVIEDHPIFRETIARAIQAAPDLELIVAAGSVEDFERANCAPPDVILLDLHLPGIEGADAVGRVLNRTKAVLVLSAAGGSVEVLAALAAGACGYLTKDAEWVEIEAAIAIVADGRSYVSPTLASFLLTAASIETPDPLQLTSRENEILTLVAQGERDQDVAAQLFISVNTVRSHLDRIRDKTGSRRRSDLTRLAAQQGLIKKGPVEL